MRWVCSNCTPPTKCGILYSEPKEVGQSGTDNPASLLVTKAPAMMSRNVQPARKQANLWRARLYGVTIPFRSYSIPKKVQIARLFAVQAAKTPRFADPRLLLLE